jgi:hypothetical protein
METDTKTLLYLFEEYSIIAIPPKNRIFHELVDR